MDILKQKYPSENCPDYEQLVSYVNLSLDEEVYQSIENHLESCGTDCLCRTIVEGLEVELYTDLALEKEPEIAEGVNHQAVFKLIEQFQNAQKIEQEDNKNPKKKSA